MKKNLLIVVDMQNDFVTGALKNEQAIAIVPAVKAKIEAAKADADNTDIVFTRDTHHADYMNTEEGAHLPVPHCMEGTWGWEVIDELKDFTAGHKVFDKLTFGSSELLHWLENEGKSFQNIELIGVCTDICVISNAFIAKAALPNAKISVDAACTAGVTPASHDNALSAMTVCHIVVNNQGKEGWRE